MGSKEHLGDCAEPNRRGKGKEVSERNLEGGWRESGVGQKERGIPEP